MDCVCGMECRFSLFTYLSLFSSYCFRIRVWGSRCWGRWVEMFLQIHPCWKPYKVDANI